MQRIVLDRALQISLVLHEFHEFSMEKHSFDFLSWKKFFGF